MPPKFGFTCRCIVVAVTLSGTFAERANSAPANPQSANQAKHAPSKSTAAKSTPAKNTSQRNFQIGLRLRRDSRFKQAISFLTQAIEADPKFAAAYETRAECLIQLEKFDEAFEDANRAISLDPKLAAAYSDRAKVYNERTDSKKAIADFSKAIELAKDKPDFVVYRNRGSLYEQAGNDDAALSDFSSALKIAPSDAWIRYFRACIYFKRGKYKDALTDVSESIKHSTDERGHFYQLRAKCYDKLGQPALAKKDRDTAQSAANILWGDN